MPEFKPLADTKLFEPVEIGALKLEHRLVQAPLTRMRGTLEVEGDRIWFPDDIAVEYYGQRANKGGFQLTEATNISRLVSSSNRANWGEADKTQCSGYPGIPGVFTDKQLKGWKRVTDAVHAKGGFIYCQLWHVGRATVPEFINGQQTISASDIPITGRDSKALNGKEYEETPPRAMTVEDIKEITATFAEAAKRAISAGFDGIEIHG